MQNKSITFRICLLLCLQYAVVPAQNSTFDVDNESWTFKGDVTNNGITWMATGGLPGGWARMIDASTGGTCYFKSPSTFRGNLLGAYKCDLEYDLRSTDSSNPNDMPQIELYGAGLKLVYSSAYVPALSWTHYVVPMSEDAGWRIDDLIIGDVPTKEQFRAVLADVTEFNIRGEFYSFGPDEAGLDNVYFNGYFNFDLDANNSSGATNGNFRADTTCYPFSHIADIDATLFCENGVQRIEIYIQNAKNDDYLVLDALPGNLFVDQVKHDTIHLSSNGLATADDFILAILNMEYEDLAVKPRRAVRVVVFDLYNFCGGLVATRYAYLPIFPPAKAGLGMDTLLCSNGDPIQLYDLLTSNPDPSGYWEPPTKGQVGIFDPKLDSADTFLYIIPKSGECIGDTAWVTVGLEYPFELGPDSTLCYDESWVLKRPPGLVDWTWSTGGAFPNLEITTPGIYGITGFTGNCTFTDSVQATFYTCKECKIYAPNVFLANDNGKNDAWRLFFECPWIEYHLEVYDRWGSLVFETFDPLAEWDGRVKGRMADPGVFAWQVQLSSEYFGKPKRYFLKGDVTLLR
jgi:gliding motility-associated-like protein